jgi:hypothetical protein
LMSWTSRHQGQKTQGRAWLRKYWIDYLPLTKRRRLWWTSMVLPCLPQRLLGSQVSYWSDGELFCVCVWGLDVDWWKDFIQWFWVYRHVGILECMIGLNVLEVSSTCVNCVFILT